MALARCVLAFIQAILCSNPILKGSFVTVLTTMIATLDLEIATLTATLGRLNVANRILEAQIQIFKTAFDAIKADLNLVLGPLKKNGACATLNLINENLQKGLGGKKFKAFQRKLALIRRFTNLAIVQDAIIKQKEKLRQDAEDFINQINMLWIFQTIMS